MALLLVRLFVVIITDLIAYYIIMIPSFFFSFNYQYGIISYMEVYSTTKYAPHKLFKSIEFFYKLVLFV